MSAKIQRRASKKAVRPYTNRQRSIGTRRLAIESLENRELLSVETFPAGSYVIDMGQATQTIGNALKPYGLVYDMVANYKVPVNWAINPAKTSFRLDPGDPIPVDFTATTTSGTKGYSGGSFIIDQALVTPAVLSALNTWKARGVVIDQLAATLTTDIYGEITSFPRAVLDKQNGALAVPYYTNAGVPSTSYRIGNPTDLVHCDDVYIMPHADPQSWSDAWKLALYNFVDQGGGLWAGCHAVSALENMTSVTVGGVTQRLNFLSNDLVPWGSHGDGTLPYSYNPAAANDPVMQIMNRLDGATTNGSEQVYVPTTLDWRSTTTVAVYDPDHPNNPLDGTSPYNKAAVVAYGYAYGDSTNGFVMYEGGHSLAKASGPANIAAQRAFFNFILTEGLNKAPQISVTPTYVMGGASTITATISGGSGTYNYQWVSSNGGIFSNPSGTWNVGDPPITTQYEMTAATDAIRLLVTDVPCGRNSIWYDSVADAPPTIDLDGNNSSGATGADYQGYFQGGGAIVPAADTDVLVADDSTTIHSATIRLTTRPDGAAETLLIDEALAASYGISVASDGSGGFFLSGAATQAQYQAVIATLQYVNSLPFPTSTERVITATVNDGTSNSNTAVSRLTYLGGSITTVDKQLYLSDPAQGMDRVDPVATSDTTTSSVPVVPVLSSDSTGMATWSSDSRRDLVYRPWNLTSYGPQGVATTDGDNYVTMASAASSMRNEAIVVGVTQNRHVSGAIWNGSAWVPIAINIAGTVTQNLGAPSQNQWWGAAVAYETASGRALLVWNTGSTLNYSIWNGASWTAAASIPAYTGTEPRQIRLASNPLSSEIVMVVTDKNEVDRALVWNGSVWGNQIQLDNNTGHNFTDASVVYERQSGRAMVAYASGTAGTVAFRTWNGSAWSAEGSVSFPVGSNNYSQWTVLASDPNSNRIVLGVESNGNDAWLNVWSGSAWGTSQLGIQNGAGNNNNLGIAVAFERTSGEVLAVYQNDLAATELQYRTWNASTGWSAGTDFGAFGNKSSRSITLRSNPYSDQIQLMVNDDAKILRSNLWGGTAFATPIQLESNTRITAGQPFEFFWDRYLAGTVTTTATFTQTSPMTSPFVLPTGGAVKVTTYIQLTSGTLPASPMLAVRLGQSGSPILTIPAPPAVTALGGSYYKLEWTGSMPANVTVPTGGQISLTLVDYDSTYSFNVLYDSNAYPSQVQLATATAITVNSAGVYSAAYPAGSLLSTAEAGQPVYVRFTVTDPFGASDITGADLLVKDSLGGTVAAVSLTEANVVASTAGSKTYEYAWTPLAGDTFTIAITAHEGTEGVTATAQTTIITTASPDLVVTKSDGGATVNAGGSVAYTINYSNAGFGDATGVLITEYLPAGTTFNAALSTPGWTAIGSGAYVYPVGALAAGAGGSVLFSVTVTSPVSAALELLDNTTQITDDGTHGADANPANNVAVDSTPVVAAPDLVIQKTDGGTSTQAGGIVLYQIYYANIGTQDAIGVLIEESLPMNATFNSAYSVGSWDTEGGGVYHLVVGELPVGASGTAAFAVTVDSPLPIGVTEISNTASIADGGTGGPDADPANNTTSDTTPISADPQADLQIAKTNGLTSVTPGNTITYTITVTNAGPSAVTGASFADAIPASIGGVGYTTVVSGGATVSPASGSGNNIGGLLNLPVGGIVTYTVTGTLDPNAIGTLTNVAAVLPPSGTLDPNTGNNTAIDEDPIVPVSDLSLQKSFTYTDLDGSGSITPGDEIVFSLTVTNSGPNAAHNVTVRDQLPNGYLYVSDDAAVNGGTYSAGTGLWSIGTIGATSPGNSAVLHIRATVYSGGAYTNVAEVFASDSFDPDSTPRNFVPTEDDYQSVTPPVQPKSDLSLAKTMALTSDLDGNGILSIGDRVTFTLTAANAGPNAATGVHVADLLPAGYSFVSYTASPGGTYNSATGDWNVGTLSTFSTATLNITATVLGGRPASAYANYAQVSASASFDPDSTPANNSTTEDDDARIGPQIADLSVNKTVALAPGGDLDADGMPSIGDQIVFTVTVFNAGPDYATGVRLVDQLSTGYAYDADDGGGVYDPSSGLWLVGAVAPGTTRTLNITATINASGVYSNTAQVTSNQHFDPDSTPNNNVASEDDQVTVTLIPGAAAQPPVAVNDSSLHNPPGPVTLNVTANDTDPNLDLAVGTVDLDPSTAGRQTFRTVAGQGTWTVDSLGNVTFTPQPGFTLDPTPISYTVQDSGGRTSNQATITIDYVPVATHDSSSGNTTGTPVTVPVLANDTTGDAAVASTVQIVGTPAPGTSLAVPGEGTWSVNTTTGAITFTPAPGFTGDPTPIQYTVQDNDGNTSNAATVTVDYNQFPPVALNDSSLANPPGPVTLNVTTNDTDPNNDVEPSTVDLDPSTPGQQTMRVVAGEGLWQVDGAGHVTFSPQVGFTLEPTPIPYTVQDRTALTSNVATITIGYLPAIEVVKTASANSVPETGGTVTFTYQVINTSPAGATDPLSAVTLTDTDGTPTYIGGDTDSNGKLDSGEIWLYTLTFAVPADNATGGSHANTATVSGIDDEGFPATDTDTATVGYNNVAPAIQVIKTASPSSVPETGGSVTYTYHVTNASSAGVFDPLHDVTLSDTNGTPTYISGDTNGDNVLQLGETWLYTLTFAVPAANATGGSHSNTVTATGTEDDGITAADTDTATVSYTNVAPAIQVVKLASPTSVPETGGTVTYTYTVTNTSPAAAFDPLHSVVLSDTDGTPVYVSGDTNSDNVLQAGETWLYALTVIVPAGNVGGSYSNTVIATGTDDEGTAATGTDSVTVTYSNVNPAIQVVKTASPSSVPETGGSVIYTYAVTNTSPAGVFDPLHGVTLNDTDGTPTYVSGDSNSDDILQAGETWLYTLTVPVPAGNATDGGHSNTAIAAGTDVSGITATDSDTDTVGYTDVAPAIQVAKFASPNSVPETGGSVTYTYAMTNTSPAGASDPLHGVMLTDTDGTPTYVSGDINNDNVLQAGEVWLYTLTFAVPAGNAAGGSHSNTATATGVDDEGTTTTDNDTATIGYTNLAPAIQVIKAASPSSVPETGGSVTYTYAVTNTSPAGVFDPLHSVVLSDTNGTPAYVSGDTNSDNILQAGETWLYTLTFAVPTGNVGGSYSNTVIATGTDDEGTAATGTDSVTVTYSNVNPTIQVVKTVSPSSVPETGGSVIYTYAVTNTSPAGVFDPLHGVTLSDTDGTPTYVSGDINADNVLQAGETWLYTLTFAVSAGNATGGSHSNTATVLGTDDEGITAADGDTVAVAYTNVAPSITVDKVGPGSIVHGQTATYSFTITNTSAAGTDPVTLTSVFDDQLGELIDIAKMANGGSDIVLNPGQSFVFSTDSLVLDPILVVNVVTVTAHDDENTTTTASDTETVTVNYPPVAANDSSLHNLPGPVAINVTANDSDPNGDLVASTVDLNPSTPGQQTTLIVAGEGTWSVDGAGNVTFTPQAGFTYDPTSIPYTVSDATGLVSNQATITVDYVPVAASDTSSGNATGTPVTVNVLSNDTLGDAVVPSTVQIVGTSNPGDPLVVPGQGTWSVNPATGAITFTPQAGYTGDPTPIQYTVQDNDGNTSNPATVSVGYVEPPPAISVDKAGPGTIAEGNPVAYVFTITNTSPVSTDPVTLTNVVDDVLGDLTSAANGAWLAQGHSGPITLAQNQTFSFSYTTLTPPNAGTIVNVVTVSGHDDEGTPVGASDTATVVVTNVTPSIAVDKTGPATLTAGSTATYVFTITNTSLASTDPVIVTSVVDDVLGDLTSTASAAWLAQGHIGSILLARDQGFTFSYTTGALDAGTIINTVNVSGHDDEGSAATASDSHTLIVSPVAQGIVVDKTGPATIAEGTTVTYTFTITNTSTGPVTVTSVVDDVLGDLWQAAYDAWPLCSAIVLDPNQSFTFSYTTTTTLNAGTVTNIVAVGGHDDEGNAVTGNDSHTLIVSNVAPSIAVDKDGPCLISEGDSATFFFTITNTSPASTDPVTVTSVIDDVLGDLTSAANAAWLARGHSGPIVLDRGQMFWFSHTTSTLHAGKVVNTVSVAGHDDENTAATASDSHATIVAAPLTANLASPAGGSTVSDWLLNSRGYLDVTFNDVAHAGLVGASIFDPAPEFLLTGPAAAGVMVNGVPELVAGTASTYRYHFTGSFSSGTVGVRFLNDAFADTLGNTMDEQTQTFDVVAEPSLWIAAPAAVREGPGKAMAFMVTLTHPSTRPVQVRYAATPGTADGRDYVRTSGVLTFLPGKSLIQTIRVPIKDDKFYEGTESMLVTLSSPTGGVPLARATATGTILDNDPAPKLSIRNVTAREGNSGMTNAVFTVSLSAASAMTTTVTFATSDGTATLVDNDYQATRGILTFKPGETKKTVAVPIAGDVKYERNETYRVTLSDPSNSRLARAVGVGMIKNDDLAPALSIGDATVSENDSQAVFTVTLSAPSGLPVTVHYATANKTALAGKDYTATGGILSFAPGVTTQTIAVPILDDTLREADETLQLKIFSQSGAKIGRNTAIGTILDNDVPLNVGNTTTVDTPPLPVLDALARDRAEKRSPLEPEWAALADEAIRLLMA